MCSYRLLPPMTSADALHLLIQLPEVHYSLCSQKLLSASMWSVLVQISPRKYFWLLFTPAIDSLSILSRLIFSASCGLQYRTPILFTSLTLIPLFTLSLRFWYQPLNSDDFWNFRYCYVPSRWNTSNVMWCGTDPEGLHQTVFIQ